LIERQLESAGSRIHAEGDGAPAVVVGVGQFPAADHFLGGVEHGRRWLRLRVPAADRNREQGEKERAAHLVSDLLKAPDL